MLIPCNINLIIAAKDAYDMYAVYVHRDATDKTIHFVGCCTLDKLFTSPDARSNKQWLQMYGNSGAAYELEVITLSNNMKEAYSEQRRLIQIYDPICNRRGFWLDTRHMRVQCVETGEIFDTATECAAAHSITASALSNHLRQKRGFNTVGGRTYKRID